MMRRLLVGVALLLGGCLKFSTVGALCNVDADCWGGDGLVCRERADFGDGRRRCWAPAEDAGADAGAVTDAGTDAGAAADAGPPTVSFTTPSRSVNESVGSVTVTVALSAAIDGGVSVPFSVSGTAMNPVDHNLDGGAFFVPAGQTSASVTFDVVDDSLDEPNETVVLTLGAPTNATLGATQVQTVTITDNDPAPTVSFGASSQTVNEDAGSVDVTVALTTASGMDVTVPFVVSGTATNPADYDLDAGAVVIAAGQTNANITFNVVNDAIDEADETVTLTLGTPTNASCTTNCTHTVTITDDDSPADAGGDAGADAGLPTVQFSATAQSVSESATVAFVYAMLSAPSSAEVSVSYTVSGSAENPADHTLGAGTITFAAQQTQVMVPVTIVNDVFDESGETIVLTLSSPTNANLGANTSHTITITDDDATPTLSINDVTVSDGIAGAIMATFTVALSAPSGQAVTVAYATADGTASIADSDYVAASGTLTFDAGETVKNLSVTVVGDTRVEEDETFFVNLSLATNATITRSLGVATIAMLWGDAGLIETDNAGNAFNPQVAVDPAGNAIAVWHQYDGTRNNIWANRHGADAGRWGSSGLIETDNAVDARNPKVAVNRAGNAIAVWEQHDGTRYNIWANRYIADAGRWGDAGLIETNNAGNAYSPQVAFDPAGNAIAVWQQFDGARYSIGANRYFADAERWGDAGLIEANNAGEAYLPQVAVDSVGNAITVWDQSDGTRNNIWANRYSADAGLWGDAGLIETDNAGSAQSPQVAVNFGGNAITVWTQFDGTGNSICANRYDADAGLWGNAGPIEMNNESGASAPQVAADTAGNAIAVWHQHDGFRYNIWANRYDAYAGRWGDAGLIETNNAGDAKYPELAVDPAGNVIAVWEQSDGARRNIWASRYSADAGLWGDAGLIESDNAGNAIFPKVAVDPAGNAIAVWSQSDGTRYNIWANVFR